MRTNSNREQRSSVRIHPQSTRRAALAVLQIVALSALLGSLPAWPADGVQGSQQELGTVSFPIACAADVQGEFERGVALLHHMMYVEARKVFEAVAADDPRCAMAQWGVAMTLFQPLWPTRPGAAELERGRSAVARAEALAAVDSRERSWVAATAAFFSDTSADYWSRIRSFETAMEQLYRSDPRDVEATAFYALSLLATAPQSNDAAAHHERAAELLLGIIDRQPRHPGAIHYTIHANDVEGRAGRSIDIVRSYDDIAPTVPHALHMPTHIFVRLGLWQDVIHWNTRSAEAALDFPAGDAISHHYPHAIDYLIYARLQRGEIGAAAGLVDELLSRDGYQPTFISAYHLAAVPARYEVEQGNWAAAAVLPERRPANIPWDSFPWPQAVTQFARGLGAARSGDLGAAATALDKLSALREQATTAGEDYFAQQIEISRLAVAAWRARAGGDNEEAVRSMRAAAELEASIEKHPVTPGAIKPAYELLGELYEELGRWPEALSAYQASLESAPGRLSSLRGVARATASGGGI